MSETLRQKRSRFGRNLVLLLQYVELRGYEYTLGEIVRGAAQAAANAASGAGIARSLHLDGLAADINLFKDGVYLEETSAHLIFGQFWKSLGADHRWGGDFKPKPDGNHYSLEHEGRK